jgi:5'-nucleotidase
MPKQPTKRKPQALIDADGTFLDFDGAMQRDLLKLMSPGEVPLLKAEDEHKYPHIKARRDLIKAQPNWWANLEPRPEGMHIVELLRQVGFRLGILTRGPRHNYSAWEQKVRSFNTHIPDARVTITSDEKSLVYGRVLVDDWPIYIRPWLKARPRGLVVMPAQYWNEDFKHNRVFRYEGFHQDAELIKLLEAQRDR